MGILIDTCAIHCVFCLDKNKHKEYKPIIKWLLNGSGIMVYGGKKYVAEFKKAAGTYLDTLAELYKAGKLIRLNDKEVDSIQEKVERLKKHKDFDDPHLIAIIIASNIKLICTTEQRAIPFIKCKDLYFNGVRPPKIYNYNDHKKLLIRTSQIDEKYIDKNKKFL